MALRANSCSLHLEDRKNSSEKVENKEPNLNEITKYNTLFFFTENNTLLVNTNCAIKVLTDYITKKCQLGNDSKYTQHTVSSIPEGEILCMPVFFPSP